MAEKEETHLRDDHHEGESVQCLGRVFSSDAERKEYYLQQLREHLASNALASLDGFPDADIEAILRLSNPPYYTACPSPFVNNAVRHYSRPYCEDSDTYNRQPYSSDVTEGKNDPLYNAHSYHTKVPHKAIMRHILHYTKPGDVVFDGFCGTGMTAVAAQLCGDRREVESLAYNVSEDGVISDRDDAHFSSLGVRPAFVSDLSPIASFIANTLLAPIDSKNFLDEASRIVKEVQAELGWIYQTQHTKGNKVGEIIYSVWADILLCSECGEEIDAWDAVIDLENITMRKEFPCPHCGAVVKRSQLDKSMRTDADFLLGDQRPMPKQRLALIHYRIGKKRYQKTPDKGDLEVLERVRETLKRYEVPTCNFEHTWQHVRDGNHLKNITHSHHYYTPRNSLALAALRDRIKSSPNANAMLFVLTGFVEGHASRRNRYILDKHHPNGTTCGPLSNTLFVSELQCEVNIFDKWKQTAKKQAKGKSRRLPQHAFVQIRSATGTGIPDNSIDYIFIDPPFGANIPYSELNLLYETWLNVFTRSTKEAVVNPMHGKGISEYGDLMAQSFAECFRILKPGRWLTLEFHNSKNVVWAAIQEAMTRAGLVVADVRVLDKKHGTIRQDAGTTVKKDLIVSAYKPKSLLEEAVRIADGDENSVWEFISQHLRQLPVFVAVSQKAETIAERQHYMLFDRMVSFHVQRGLRVPLSISEFHLGLQQRFPERDGMYFLPEQVGQYDKKRMAVSEVVQLKLFVSDESSAIQWLRNLLGRTPLPFAEIQPQFMREIGGWQKHEKTLELSELLEQNFLKYEVGSVPSQIHSYLSSNFKELRNLNKDDMKLAAKAKDRWYVPDPRKEGDLEKIRNRALMKEFQSYRESKGKLKTVRTEALRAGFKYCWQQNDYATIVAVAGRVREEIIQEDPALLMYFDNACMLTGG